jgi:hypothetical protein
MIAYRYMNATMNGILSGTEKVTTQDVFVNYLMASEKMRMDMHMLMAMYGVTNKITVMAMLDYNFMSMSMSMLPGSTHHHAGATTEMEHDMKTSGIGDLKLHFLYGLINKERHHLLISAGVNIPTGNSSIKGTENSMYPNKRLPYAMQLGAGTYDVLPCINYLHQNNKATFGTQVSSVIRTGYNTVGYQLGNEAAFNGWFAYQWFNFLSSSLRIEGSIADKIKGYDPTLYYYNELAANPSNYGGKKINTYIGSVFNIKKGCMKNSRLGIEYGIPVYQNLNGTQMKLEHTLYVSCSTTF